MGGVPKFAVCDNLGAVTNPDRYDPGLNRICAEMAKPGCRSGITNRRSAIFTLIWETPPPGRGRLPHSVF
ncbi:MAG: hypothetical protein EOS77_04365 [Mesorhizobium sp.]|nr:MAG: hypothetical protein EOS77_04365 [Mesorhizobium sp.]